MSIVSLIKNLPTFSFVKAYRNSAGQITALLDNLGFPISGTEQAAWPSLITKYGKSVLSVAMDLSPNMGTTNINTSVDPVAWDFTRHGFATRRILIDQSITPGTNYAQVRFPNLTIIPDTADPTDRGFSLCVYLQNHPNEFLGAGKTPTMNVRLSQVANGSAGPSETWTFNANFLRQGWNILPMREKDFLSTSSSIDDEGNLPKGVTHRSTTPMVWTNNIQYLEITFNNMDTWDIRLDDLRRAAKGFTVFNMGFDAGGINSTDDTFISKVVPLFAKYGFTSYMTVSGVDTLYTGGQDWNRRIMVHTQNGWNIIPHIKSHGATAAGGFKVASGISRTNNVVTVTFAAHGLTPKQGYKVNLSGFVTYPSLAQSVKVTVPNATTITFASVGADFAAGNLPETGTITMRTFLSEVLNSDTPENQQICDMEVVENVRTLRGMGFNRDIRFLAFPNNSAPHLTLLARSCAKAGVLMCRGQRSGFIHHDEFGIDNPLHIGSYELGSGSGGTGAAAGGSLTTVPYILSKVDAAVERGVGFCAFGHYAVDENMYLAQNIPVNLDYPPGAALPGGGNNPIPASIVAAGGGGAWWVGSIEKVLARMKYHVDSGKAIYLGTSAMVSYYMGN